MSAVDLLDRVFPIVPVEPHRNSGNTAGQRVAPLPAARQLPTGCLVALGLTAGGIAVTIQAFEDVWRWLVEERKPKIVAYFDGLSGKWLP